MARMIIDKHSSAYHEARYREFNNRQIMASSLRGRLVKIDTYTADDGHIFTKGDDEPWCKVHRGATERTSLYDCVDCAIIVDNLLLLGKVGVVIDGGYSKSDKTFEVLVSWKDTHGVPRDALNTRHFLCDVTFINARNGERMRYEDW